MSRSIVIYDIIGCPWAICDEDARQVARCVDTALSAGDDVSLSFLYIDLLSLVFVNHFVWSLRANYSVENLQEKVLLKYAHKAFFSLYQERLKAS